MAPSDPCYAVRNAVASLSTCNEQTLSLLRELLQDRIDLRRSRQEKTPRTSAPSTSLAELSAKDRARLASHVVNTGLKAIGEAVKSLADQHKHISPHCRTEEPHSRLRVSDSVPSCSLQPKPLKQLFPRIANPIADSKTSSEPQLPHLASSLALVECIRISFATLQKLEFFGIVTLSPLQLEHGMATFVSRLLQLGLQEQAAQELQVLRDMLIVPAGSRDDPSGILSKREKATSAANPIYTILDFSSSFNSNAIQWSRLSLILAAQSYAIRLLVALKPPSPIEAVLSSLRETHPTSPLNLATIASQLLVDETHRSKCARQIESISQSVFNLASAFSNKSNASRVETMEISAASSILEIQALGLQLRLAWWNIAGYVGDTEHDILLPLSKYMAKCYSRLSCLGSVASYPVLFRVFNNIVPNLRLDKNPQSTYPILSSIYQILASSAQQCSKAAEFMFWMSKIEVAVTPDMSAAKCCCLRVNMAIFLLKDSKSSANWVDSLSEVLRSLANPLKGDNIELKELLDSVVQLRKTAAGILSSGSIKTAQAFLEEIVLQCPNFLVRWLGKAPDASSTTKDSSRYEQRWQSLIDIVPQTVDTALWLLKFQLDAERLDISKADGVLGNCSALLECMNNQGSEMESNRYVKISHLYLLMHHMVLQGQCTLDRQDMALHTLRRSVESVRGCGEEARRKARFGTKLERLADKCKSAGLNEEARRWLMYLRNDLIKSGVLSSIAQSLSVQSPRLAWMANEDAKALSRCLIANATVDPDWIKWANKLPPCQKAAVLEHWVYFIMSDTKSLPISLCLTDPPVAALLAIYTPTNAPLRRLRLLLRLMSINLDDTAHFSKIRLLTETTMHHVENSGLGNDHDLQPYLKHLKALFIFLGGLAGGYLNLELLEKSLSIWRSAVDHSASLEELKREVDCPEDLVLYLESAADLLTLQGKDSVATWALDLSLTISKFFLTSPDLIVNRHISLAQQYTRLGFSSKTQNLMDQTKIILETIADPSRWTIARFHLCYAEHLLELGYFEGAHLQLEKVRETIAVSTYHKNVPKSRNYALVPYACLLFSTLALEQGDAPHALQYVRSALRVLYQDWSNLESALPKYNDQNCRKKNCCCSSKHRCPPDIADLSSHAFLGPAFWRIARPMISCLFQLASVHSHLGMFKETIYYAERAFDIAKVTGSQIQLTRMALILAKTYVKSHQYDKARDFLTEARLAHGDSFTTHTSILLACDISEIYRQLGDQKREIEMLEAAQAAALLLTQEHDQISPVSKSEACSMMNDPPQRKQVRYNTRTRTLNATANGLSNDTVFRKELCKDTGKMANLCPLAADNRFAVVQVAILTQRALSSMGRREWITAFKFLQEASKFTPSPTCLTREQVSMAWCLIREGMDCLTQDPIFSIIHESALCFPAIPSLDAMLGSSSLSLSSPLSLSSRTFQRKGRKACKTPVISPNRTRSKLVDKLVRAQQYLVDINATVMSMGDMSMVKTLAEAHQAISIVLSAACSPIFQQKCHAPSTPSPIDLSRNLLWNRDQRVLSFERDTSLEIRPVPWPIAHLNCTSTAANITDLGRFQKECLDMLPIDWNVISISVDVTTDQLTLINFAAAVEPMVIRVPINRDTDCRFSFAAGRQELLDLVARINESCHSGAYNKEKSSKKKWWDDRKTLENEMADFLRRVEQYWLGGFKGIFSQHIRHPSLLAKFRQELDAVLHNHLPSRQRPLRIKRRARHDTHTKFLSLDAFDNRILELFIGLGDPGDLGEEAVDLTDEIGDLLNFITDILEWHGEQNARDEIDWDSMILDTRDILAAYHAAVADSSKRQTGRHTILVLDSQLHVFPWENMNCLRSAAVSRAPSLAYLHNMLVSHSVTNDDNPKSPPGVHVDANCGAFILDPGADLPNTRKAFEQPLSASLGSRGWESIIGTEPSEAQFASILQHKDTLLYFGHGSGSQFIRSKVIRKIPTGVKSVGLLMGCSSAATVFHGEFELSGPIWTLLSAGSPCVVGALWDVTDKDIDKFASSICEEWCLFNSPLNNNEPPCSLIEAVVKARVRCKLRLINAGAVVVYGIPAYVLPDQHSSGQ